MTAFTRALRGTSARRIAAASVVAAGALLLAACGDNKDDGMSGADHGSGAGSATATAQAGNTASAADHNDADVTFSQMMIPHHKQAVEMAELADGRASDPDLKNIAAKIKKAQGPEINTMTGWLRSWGKPTALGDMPGMHMGNDGMMSDKDMKALKSMKGAGFDKMFAQMMIQHHKGAITMAKDEQKKGRNAGATKMAGAIATSQSAEVKQLQSILDRL
ncbi:DUF305 domain-containing protein [Streptomyces sp. NPDC020801]|uniref:DUF305 domain-containing protein n=1 Tax=unclassified Streptomyces TaxID=2593676 RepID=UPI003795A423